MGDLVLDDKVLKDWASAKRADLLEIARLRQSADAFSEKIRAFIVLGGDTLDSHTLEWAKATAAATSIKDMNDADARPAPTGPNLIDAIHKVLVETKAPVTVAEIRDLLPAVGYSEPVTSATGYFYTAIARLIERGLAERLPDKTVRAIAGVFD